VERWKLQEDLAAQAHQNVDLVDLRRASTVMRVQVLRDGRLLADVQPSVRASFEATRCPPMRASTKSDAIF
jgi:hypothetical protein